MSHMLPSLLSNNVCHNKSILYIVQKVSLMPCDPCQMILGLNDNNGKHFVGLNFQTAAFSFVLSYNKNEI